MSATRWNLKELTAPVVIAEIGVNHDGDPRRAAELIDAAYGTGVYGVKLQYFKAHRLMSADARLARYQVGVAADPVALLEPLALSIAVLGELRERAAARGLAFVVTPFSLADVEELRPLGLDAVKVASPDAVNTPLLEAAAGLGVPVIVSTGAAELAELDAAAAVARASGGALLHCVSSYPTPEGDAALGGIAALRAAFDGVAVGYSDHTVATDTGGLAVAAGAVVLEKHLTYDRTAAGPDHASSQEAAGLAAYVRSAQRAAAMLGPAVKRCWPVEEDVRTVSRQSLVAVRDLEAGHVLTAEDLTIKRPGTGLPARMLREVVGKRLLRGVRGDHVLRAGDV